MRERGSSYIRGTPAIDYFLFRAETLVEILKDIAVSRQVNSSGDPSSLPSD